MLSYSGKWYHTREFTFLIFILWNAPRYHNLNLIFTLQHCLFFIHSSQLRRRTAVRSRPRWGRRACRWASLRRFLTVCAEILWLCKPIVAAAVRVAGLRTILEVKMLDVEVLGWCGYMWSAVVRPVGCTANSLKRLWRRLMVEKLTFNSQATALVFWVPCSTLSTHTTVCPLTAPLLLLNLLMILWFWASFPTMMRPHTWVR